MRVILCLILCTVGFGQNYDRPVSLKQLLPNLLDDQKQIYFAFPRHLLQGQDWLPTASFMGVTGGLIATDPSSGRRFRQATVFHGFNGVFTSRATAIGTLVAPVSLYAAGLIRKDSKMQHTALLAGEAVADSEILATALKASFRRARPADIAPTGNFSNTWFQGKGASGSFPSGHTIAAFSVATVVARRYRNHAWVPYAAYGLAAAVGFSRLSLSAHFVSDVFAGAAFGYAISRYGVLRQ